jgi:cysteine-rich repeat protein
VDNDGDRVIDVVRVMLRDALGRLTTVAVDEDVDGLTDVEEQYAYEGNGPLKTITRRRLSTGRVEAVTQLEVDAEGRVSRRTVDDFGDGVVDSILTYVYGPDGKPLEEFIQAQDRTTRCVLSYAGNGLEQDRRCVDVDTQAVLYVRERVYDAAGNLVGELRDEGADGTVDVIERATYACWTGMGSASSSSSSSSSTGGTASTATGSSSLGGSTSSGGGVPTCQDTERGPTSPTSPQAIPVTCPSWVLTQGSLEPATEEDVFVVRLAAGERLTVETYGMAPGVCAGVDTVVDVRAWPLNASTRLPYCSGGSDQLACDDDGGVDACSRLRFDALVAGDYTVRVVSLGHAAAVSRYGMTVTVQRPGCGDGRQDAGEACDDGNTVPGDGCTAACALEGDACASPVVLTLGATPRVFTGLTTTGQTNAYSAACATSTTSPDTVFTFTPSANGTVRAILQGLDGFDGVLALSRVTCTPGTGVACQNATGPGDVESLGAAVVAGTQYWLHVDGHNVSSGRYQLSVALEPAACGNGVVEAGEECDDGNSVSNDGCSAACVDECRTQGEVGTTDYNTPMVVPSFCTTWQLVAGAITPATDQDFFRVSLATGQQLRVDTYGPTPNACLTSAMDTVVDVRAAPLSAAPPQTGGCNSGNLACNDDASSSSWCSALRWTATTTGDFVVRVKYWGGGQTIPNYSVTIAKQ